jgi:hypothetical protein
LSQPTSNKLVAKVGRRGKGRVLRRLMFASSEDVDYTGSIGAGGLVGPPSSRGAGGSADVGEVIAGVPWLCVLTLP